MIQSKYWAAFSLYGNKDGKIFLNLFIFIKKYFSEGQRQSRGRIEQTQEGAQEDEEEDKERHQEVKAMNFWGKKMREKA
jgi:hypothetical protein